MSRWLACIIFSVAISCSNPSEPELIADVAIYADAGCWQESVQAAQKMFEWMGYTVAWIKAGNINSGELDRYRLLCVPGGDMYQYAQDISSQGMGNIRNFIRKGGGYIGICGGAYFAAEKVFWQNSQLSMASLNLFSGTAKGPVNEIVAYPKYGICQINIFDKTHPIAQSAADNMWILYYWGPEFTLNSGASNVDIIGWYERGGSAAMLAITYGTGRAFIIGTHPEIEEDSGRDGVDWGDELDDHESDWELMKHATQWCLRDGVK
ncbi:hypothetical protein JXJ21_25350 [candidate division KSB1 bacterium]|nr:hypothetical protein [candidate division KSB1 bacterium]